MKRWRRRVLFGLAAVAVLLLTAQGLALWMARPKARAALGRWVAAKLEKSLGEPVEVAEAWVQLFPLQLSVRGVRVGSEVQPFLVVEAAQANLGSVELQNRQLSLNLLRVRGLKLDSKAALAPSGQGSAGPLRLAVRQLVVEGARVDHLRLAEGVTLSVKNLELMVSGRPGRGLQGGFLRAGSVSLEGAGPMPLSGALQAWGQVGPGNVLVRRLVVRGEGFFADGAGEIAWNRGVAVAFTAKVSSELEAVDQVFGIDAGLSGTVHATATLSVAGGSFAVDARVTAPRVGVAGFVVEDVAGSVHVSADGVEATLDSGRFASGTVEGSYQLGDLGPAFPHKVAVRAEGVDVDGFLAFLGVGRGGLGARANVNAELSWEGKAIKAGRGVAVVRLNPVEGAVPASGQVVVALRGNGELSFEAQDLAVGGGTVWWRGTLSLGSWMPRWRVESPGLPLEAVATLLAGWVGTPVLPRDLTGTAVFDLEISGRFDRVHVAGPVAVSPVCFGPLEADALEGQLTFGGGSLRFTNGTLALGRGTLRFAGELDLTRPVPGVTLDYAGKGLPLGRIARWAGIRFPLEGSGAVTGTLSGNLDHPELAADLRFEGVTVAGLPLGGGEARATLEGDVLRVDPLAVGGVSGKVEVDFASHRVAVATRVRGLGLEPLSPVLARLLGGQVEAEFSGDFPWEEPAGRLAVHSAQGVSGSLSLGPRGLEAFLERPGQWRLSAEVSQKRRLFAGSAKLRVNSLGLVLGDLLGSEVPVDGELDAEIALRAEASGPPTLAGTITKAALVAEGEKVELAQPAPFTLRGIDFDLPGLRLVGPAAQLFVRGSRHEDGRIAGNVMASVPASLFSLFWRDAAPRGRVEVLGEVSGTDAEPRFDGVLRVFGGSLRIPGLPAPVTSVDGLVELAGDVATLRNVRFAFQGGTGTCSGQIKLWPSLELDLSLRVAAVRWSLAPGLEPNLDGELRLTGDLAGLQLSGDLQLRRTLYRREVTLQRLVLDELLGRERTATPGRGLVAFDVRVVVPGTFEVHTPLARVVAQGELHLVGDSNQPGVLGQLELLPGGEVELSGVVYEVERASIRFTDASGIRPVIDLQARGIVQNFTVTVGLSGTLERLVPTLTSDPPLPESDILALLALGVAPSAPASAAASASAMASSFLTEQLTGAVTKRTRTLLSLDQLRIDPFVTTESGTPTARVTAVKQLSPDWSVTVSTNLSSNREEVIVSRWRVGKDLFLEATRDTDGSYSLEVKWRRRY
ncbi:MAG: translocation/assembly module TamB domain-containing protein [Thermoanaerobaculum sp.]